jgi:subtilisin family serine protease
VRRAAPLLAATLVLGAAGSAAAAGTPAQRTWHSDQLRSGGSAASAGKGGAGVLVAVLDSWVDGSHKDFEGRVLAGADCTGGSCRAGQGQDQCDHGTHVAGTVASSSYGVAPRARVLPVRVLTYDSGSGDCVGRPSDVAAGIRWAVSQGARVINLSLGPDVPGLSSSSAIPTAVAEAADAGAVVVFSAGNTGAPVTDSYGDDALIVAATGPSGALASYSQRGVGVDLAAPGGDPADEDACSPSDCVTSLYPGGRYAVAAGTSMAAPQVAGVAALLLAQSPGRTPAQVADRLRSTARPLAQAGSGLVDATRALGATTSAAPRPRPSRTAASSPLPVVRGNTRPSRPAATTTTKAAPAAPRTSAAAPRPTASAVATPSSSAPALAAPPPGGVLVVGPEEVPAGLAVFAGGLAMTAAVSVAVVGTRPRRQL